MKVVKFKQTAEGEFQIVGVLVKTGLEYPVGRLTMGIHEEPMLWLDGAMALDQAQRVLDACKELAGALDNSAGL